MQKVSSKDILKKVYEWKDTPEMVPAVYRLFVFLHWDEIPEEYQKMYDARAKDIWDNDYDLIWKNVEEDTEVTIKAVLEEMLKRNVVASFGLLPIIISDMFIRGYKTGSIQGKMMGMINNYRKYINVDRGLAELDTLNKLHSFLNDYCIKSKVKLSFDLETVIDKIFKEYMKFYGNDYQSSIEESVEKVLEEYEKKAGESNGD